MFKTGSGERSHLYEQCAGQQQLYRWNQERFRVCARCLGAWRKAVDAEMALYLENHNQRRSADAAAADEARPRWICMRGRSRKDD